MDNIYQDPVYKILIRDVCQLVKNEEKEDWLLQYDNKVSYIKRFHIQGTILKITGLNNEICIISDGTGKVKITRSPNVPGSFTWVKVGAYCSTIGMLLECGKLPHIAVIKFCNLNYNPLLKEMWPFEVKEFHNLMTDKILPVMKSIITPVNEGSDSDFSII